MDVDLVINIIQVVMYLENVKSLVTVKENVEILKKYYIYVNLLKMSSLPHFSSFAYYTRKIQFSHENLSGYFFVFFFLFFF